LGAVGSQLVVAMGRKGIPHGESGVSQATGVGGWSEYREWLIDISKLILLEHNSHAIKCIQLKLIVEWIFLNVYRSM
jgi:hypothetical protein